MAERNIYFNWSNWRYRSKAGLSRFSTWRICSREQRKKQLDWLATNTDDITSQSHSLFACSCEKIAKWKTGFSANRGLKFVLFSKTSEKKTPIDPDTVADTMGGGGRGKGGSSLNSYFQSLNSYFQSLNSYFETVADTRGGGGGWEVYQIMVSNITIPPPLQFFANFYLLYIVISFTF